MMQSIMTMTSILLFLIVHIACGVDKNNSLLKSPRDSKRCAKAIENLASFDFNALPQELQSNILARLDVFQLVRLSFAQKEKNPLVQEALANMARKAIPQDRLKEIEQAFNSDPVQMNFELATRYLINQKHIHDRSIKLRPAQTFHVKIDGRDMAPVELSEGHILTLHQKTFSVWDAKNGELVKSFATPHDSRTMVGLDKGQFAQTNPDHSISIWDSKEGTVSKTLVGHSRPILEMRTLEDGMLASVSYDGTVRIWNPDSGELLTTLRDSENSKNLFIQISRDRFATSNQSNQGQHVVRIWDRKQAEIIETYSVESQIYSLFTLSDQKLLGVHTKNHGLMFYDLATHQRIFTQTHEIFTNPLHAIRVLKSGSVVFAEPFNSFKSVRVVWITKDRTVVERIFDHGENVMHMAFPSDQLLISKSAQRVSLWNIEDGTKIKDFEGDRYRSAMRLILLGEDRWIVAHSGSSDVKYQLYDLWRASCEPANRSFFDYIRSFINIPLCRF